MSILKSARTPNAKRPKGARNLTLRAEKAQRRTEAEARQTAYSALTLDEKIARVLVRGGSQHELARLMKQKEGAQPTLVEKTVEVIAEKVAKKETKRKRKLMIFDAQMQEPKTGDENK